jgi:hypothetical protein
MERMNIRPTATLTAILLTTLAGCEAKKSSNPLSPSVAGPIPGVQITVPVLLEPAQGLRYKESQQPIKLVIQNATTSGVRPITYTFEIATTNTFETKVFARAGVAPGADGKTSVQADRLDVGRAYFWRARADDGANTSAYASANFEVLPKPELSVPALWTPVNGVTASSRTPTLIIGNSTRNAAVGDVRYQFQVAKDAAFTSMSATGDAPEGSGQTQYAVDRTLDPALTYYWRARATDGDTTTSWSGSQTFRTPAAAPAPSPSPSPSPAPGAPCNSSNPQKIIECERAKYGHMSSSQTVDFLKASAVSLGRNGISGAPFGLLRKAGGSSCNGYSCDILCAGQGSGQRQWDVLGDAEGSQTPAWNGPLTAPNIRVDVCDIQ